MRLDGVSVKKSETAERANGILVVKAATRVVVAEGL